MTERCVKLAFTDNFRFWSHWYEEQEKICCTGILAIMFNDIEFGLLETCDVQIHSKLTANQMDFTVLMDVVIIVCVVYLFVEDTKKPNWIKYCEQSFFVMKILMLNISLCCSDDDKQKLMHKHKVLYFTFLVFQLLSLDGEITADVVFTVTKVGC